MRRSVLRHKPPRLGFYDRAVYWTPHPKKRHTGGEDAYVATDHVLGVLDGISWWGEKYGVSAAMYSEHLARAVHEVHEEWGSVIPPSSVDSDGNSGVGGVGGAHRGGGGERSASRDESSGNAPRPSVALLHHAYARTQAAECSHLMASTLAKAKLASDHTEAPPKAAVDTLHHAPTTSASEQQSSSSTVKRPSDVTAQKATNNKAALQQRAATDVFRDHPDEVKKLMERTGCLIGSTTALIATVTPDKCLDVASLGDCTLLHFRGAGHVKPPDTSSAPNHHQSINERRRGIPTSYDLLFQSKSLVHGPSTPYQLGTGSRSVPEDSLHSTIPVEIGDLVLLGSDGLFDNLPVNQICDLFTRRIVQAHERKLQKGAETFFSDLKYRLERAKREEEKEKSRTLSASTKVAMSGSGANSTAPVALTAPASVFFPLAEQSSFYAYHREAMQQLVDASNSKEETLQLALMIATMECVQEAMITAADPRARTPYGDMRAADGEVFEGGKLDDVTVVAAVIGEDPFDHGDRVVSSLVARPPPYKNWP